MPRKGYSYNFKMFMEGIAVPFQSANIICSPNGVEASINCHSNEQLLELKPKTAIQIMYKDWCGKNPLGWHLLCDAFLSRFDKNEDAKGGVGVAIQARDFRMDIRKAPAALSYSDAGDISGGTYYHTAGVFQHTTYKTDIGTFDTATRTFDNSGLNDLEYRVIMIANTAAGGYAIKQGTQRSISTGEYYGQFSKSFPQAQSKNKTVLHSNMQGNANGGFFLDAFVRGIWLDAAGGSKLGTFLNKRIRSDKRFMVPINNAGFNMWKAQHLGQIGGEAAMADSQFTSIEAIIMRIAGMFMVRVYSCNTPNLISLLDGSPALEYVMNEDVRHFCVKIASKEFGPPYMLNSSMLLPPLEFTAPPDCNLIFPCMYHRVVWQYDMDAEITRGYFTATDCFNTEGSPLSIKWGHQVPNGLFYMPKADPKSGKQKASSVPEYKASRLTLEERYKGVNVMTGTVEEMVAYRELNKFLYKAQLKQGAADKLEAGMRNLNSSVQNSGKSKKSVDAITAAKAKAEKLNKAASDEAAANVKQFLITKNNEKAASNIKSGSALEKVLNHHALLKFINTRYAGRVITVEMAFNPYLMAGFPAIVIADDHGDGIKTLKSMIGMCQQVKHFITRDGEAVSSVVINNVRFIDEPTDIDDNGNPLYCQATDPYSARIDKDLKYVNPMYKIGQGHNKNDVAATSEVKSVFIDSKQLDIRMTDNPTLKKYKYAKDLLAISSDDVKNGKINGIYLDEVYSPNKISQFYKAVFNQRSNFMVGNTVSYNFMYDSVHEAIENLTTNPQKRGLLSNYEDAIEYIRRDVCCEEGFFCGILGLSIDQQTPAGSTEYVMKSDSYDLTATREEYFGISNKQWPGLDKEIKANTITKPGLCSSITESSPVTAFIEERKEAVRAYKKSVLAQVESVSFSNEQI
jgi:hypothetical protein